MNSDDVKNISLSHALSKRSIGKIKKILNEEYNVKVSASNKIDECKEIVKICLDKKIDTNESNNYSTLLHFVIRQLDSETFKSVLKKSIGFNINALSRYNCYNQSLLHLAIEKRKQNIVKQLLEFGADANIKDFYKRTPLFYAVERLEYKITEMLLKAKAKVNTKDRRKRTAISYIFESESHKFPLSIDKKLQFLRILELLCAHGVNMNFNNKDGEIILYDACYLGLFDEVQFLLENGAKSFPERIDRRTLLHAAVSGLNFQLIEFLLLNGLDINAESNDGSTPLRSAIFFNHYPKLDSLSRSKKMKGHVEMIEFLIDNSANVNGIALSGCINDCSPSIMECLFEFNVDINDDVNDVIHLFGRCPGDSSCSDIKALRLFIAIVATTNDDFFEYKFKIHKGHFTWMEKFFEKCKLEFDQMNKIKIHKDSNVSYSNLLFTDLMKVAIFCRNEEIIPVLESGVYKKKFPSYRFWLEKRIERAQSINNYMQIYTQFLNNFFKASLPIVVVHTIFSFLKPGDLRNFMRALDASLEITQ